MTPEVEQEVRQLATQLGETQAGPIKQFLAITAVRGISFVREIADETLRIEEQGGMLTNDKKRRRTPGGVFFYLARGRLNKDERTSIFGATSRGQPASMTAHLPPFSWDEWPEILEKLYEKPGGARTVSVQLIGRPVQVDEYEQYVAVQIVHTSNYPSMPRGVPEMQVGDRPYTAYCTPEQWAAVKDALDADPEEYLVVNGVPGLSDGDVRVYTDTILTSKMYAAELARKRTEKKQDTQTDAKPDKRDKAGKGGSKPAAKAKPARAAKPPAVPILADIDIPDGLPPAAEKKLRELMASATVFRQKIARIESQPEDQRFGLEMTRKLLQNVENEIQTLLARHT